MTVKSLWVIALGWSSLVACADGGGKPVPQPTTERPRPNAERPASNEQSPEVNSERPPSNDQAPTSESSPGNVGVANGSGGSGSPGPDTAERCSAADQCIGCETTCDKCKCALGKDSQICVITCR